MIMRDLIDGAAILRTERRAAVVVVIRRATAAAYGISDPFRLLVAVIRIGHFAGTLAAAARLAVLVVATASAIRALGAVAVGVFFLDFGVAVALPRVAQELLVLAKRRSLVGTAVIVVH